MFKLWSFSQQHPTSRQRSGSTRASTLPFFSKSAMMHLWGKAFPTLDTNWLAQHLPAQLMLKHF